MLFFLFDLSGTALTAGLPDRGRDKERRGSLQLLPSRPVFRVGTANPDLMCSATGHNRCSKPSLTVEEVTLSPPLFYAEVPLYLLLRG